MRVDRSIFALRSYLVVGCFALACNLLQAADLPAPLVTGLKAPESVCVSPNGGVFVTEIGSFGVPGDGRVVQIKEGKIIPFATGLNDPKGIVATADALYVADVTKVVKIDLQGKISTLAEAEHFPAMPLFLNDLVLNSTGSTLFVSDSGDLKGSQGAVYQIDLKTGKVDLLVNAKNLSAINKPNGLAMDGDSFLLVADFGTGILYRVNIATGTSEKVAEGFAGSDGVLWDKFGRLFITSWEMGKVFGIARPGEKPVVLPYQFESAADSCLAPSGQEILVPDMKAGTLTAIPTTIPGWEVDTAPLAIATTPAFTNVEWTGWESGEESGKPNALRPILLTHAGDGNPEIYVPTQQGVVHRFANSDAKQATTVVLDITDRVRYSDKQNEEGLLGMAFHPKFQENGEVFIFYTDVKSEMANVVSRFRTSKTDPTMFDPASEEVLLRFEKPFWNHDGGTLTFGPDGYLYVIHGDGGAGGDPHKNGQKLSTILGKILRIDVDNKSGDKPYAIPSDNPFVKTKGAAPEIWAYGIRNIWRMAFDRKTGKLWAGEVGQNLFEEVNIIKAGDNLGWSLRESLHPFGPNGVGVQPELVEPIWEYHHDLGKSITGGLVYRGKQFPELEGAYLYADYVTTKVWALWYDEAKGRVVANREIKGPTLPILSFGEDAEGEVYLLSASVTGQGIHRLVKAEEQ